MGLIPVLLVKKEDLVDELDPLSPREKQSLCSLRHTLGE